MCGKQLVLVNEVVDSFKVGHYEFADSTNVWDHLNQFTIDDVSRTVIVRSAAEIKDWAPLTEWVGTIKKHPNINVVFISLEPISVECVAAHHITCNGLSFQAAKGVAQPDIVLWLQKWAKRLSPLHALYLMDRVGGDLKRAKDVCVKLSLFRREISKGIINVLTDVSVGSEFVNLLIKNEKSKACMAAQHLSREDYSGIVGLLEYHIGMLGRINTCHKTFKSKKDAMCDESIPNMEIILYWEAARVWDANRRNRARQALGALDAALSLGSVPGWPAALVALW